MPNTVKLQNAVTAKGRAAITYRDGKKNRVKYRYESENHAFQEMFQTFSPGTGAAAVPGWFALLNNTATVYLILTDDDTPPDNSFPYIMGDIIGWGLNGADGSGDRGAYLAGESWNALRTPQGLQWKYVYDFASTQAQGDIKSMYLTNQFGNAYNLPVRRIGHTQRGECNLYIDSPQHGGGRIGHRVTSSGSPAAVNLTRYDPIDNTIEQRNITSLLNAVTPTAVNCGLYYDYAENVFYIHHRHATAANRRIYKVNADFTETLAVFTPPTTFDVNLMFVGFAYQGKLYGYNQTAGTFWSFDTSALTFTAADFTYAPPPFMANAAQSAATSCLIKDGKAFYHSSVNGVGTANPIIDIPNRRRVSWIGNGDSWAGAAHIIKNPFSAAGAPITSSNANQQFTHRNALCKFIPENLPPREPGDPMTVEYTVDVEY